MHPVMPHFTFVIHQGCLLLTQGIRYMCVMFSAHGNLREVAQGFKNSPCLVGKIWKKLANSKAPNYKLFFKVEKHWFVQSGCEKERNSEAIQTLAKPKGKMESQSKRFSSLSAFTDVAISINIPSCNLSVTFLKSIFWLQEEAAGWCWFLHTLFHRTWMCQSNNWGPSQLGRRVQVFLADRGQGADGRGLEGKQGFPLDDINVFFTRADVGKSIPKWKGHCNSSAAESASVRLVNQHRVFPRNLHLRGISQRLVRHKVCWAAEQDTFKSCLLLNWYLGLSWAAAWDDGCGPFWFCFVQVMTWPHSLWADCSWTEKTGKGWASIITVWQGLGIRPGTGNQFELHCWITDIVHCPS